MICLHPAPPGRRYLLALPSAVDPVTPPWLVVQTPPPWLLPPSAPAGTIKLTAKLASLDPAVPPRSDIASPAPQTCDPPLQLHLATPSLRHHLSPQLLWLCLSPSEPWFLLEGLSLQLLRPSPAPCPPPRALFLPPQMDYSQREDLHYSRESYFQGYISVLLSLCFASNLVQFWFAHVHCHLFSS